MDERSYSVSASVKDRAMDVAPVGIVLSDPHTADNPLIYVNDTFVEITGYSREEIIGQNCRFLQGSETADEPVRHMREAIDAEEPVTVELRNYRANGDTFWNEVTIAPVRDESGDLLHFVGFQSDVTERKEAERALKKRTDELEHLIDRLDGLIHDITEELMHATSRDETEMAICERLAATNPYCFAWVGVLNPAEDTIEPTNWAGELDGLTSEPLLGSVSSRLGAALETGDVESVTEKRHLQELGAPDSVAASAIIPLNYRTQQYGVLVVGSNTQQLLQTPEPAVLGALGRTIATAIHAAQTRRQLAEDTRVVAEFLIRTTDLTAIAIADQFDASLTYEGGIEQRDGSVSMFYTIDTVSQDFQQAVSAIDAVESITVLRTLTDRQLIEIRESPPCLVSWLAELGARVANLAIESSQARLELEIIQNVDARAIVDRIQDRYPQSELVAYRTEERPPQTRNDFVEQLNDQLTDQQRLALSRAFLSGFYDRQRSTTGEELAESMDISRATFHQHRRTAERKLIETFFDG